MIIMYVYRCIQYVYIWQPGISWGDYKLHPLGIKSGGPLGTLGKIIEVNGRFCSMPCSISAG
jgi:hypothetical protein